MPATYEPIATTTLGSAQATIEFTSISGTYSDLRIVLVCKNSTGNSNVNMTFNNITTTTYSVTRLKGNGTAASSNSNTNQTRIGVNDDFNISTEWQFFTIDIFNYAGSTFKTCLISSNQDSNGSGQVGNYVGMWRDTGAITSVKFNITTNNFAIGTTATLYGITKA